MKTLTALAITLVLASFNARADISSLDWMTGCWALIGHDLGSIEQWSSPAGGTMLGFNRVVSDGKTVAFEYLRIVQDGNNSFALIASPSGQETARFEMIELTNNRIVFENAEHDFPQRIIYRLDDDGNLVGRIEGLLNGAPRAADFPMTRASCDDRGAKNQR